MKVSFLTSIGVNVGDEFIREGIRAVLDATGIPYNPFYINKHAKESLHYPLEDETEFLDDKYWDADIFIQCGSPVYWHLLNGKSTTANSDWFDWLWLKRVFNVERIDHPNFLNLGAGSCQPWDDDGSDFVSDEACADFARTAGVRSSITTVRDPLASAILRSLHVDHHELPCPAFLAAARHQPPRRHGDHVAINLMALGGHYNLNPSFDRSSWLKECLSLIIDLRKWFRVCFVAHDEEELQFLKCLALGDENIFFSKCWRAYLDFYSQCAAVVANRVHGAVSAAGFGVPGIIIGNDSRAKIGEYIHIPIMQADDFDSEHVLELVSRLVEDRSLENERLTNLRDKVLQEYVALLLPSIAISAGDPKRKCSTKRGSSVCILADCKQLQLPTFVGWMQFLNSFATSYGLVQHTALSKIWEYPWLWFNGLNKIDWNGKRVIDIGSGLSPMPWHLATLGAKVTIVERSPQWVTQWEAIKNKLAVDVDWMIVDNEILPVHNESVDVVTSFSVIEHQMDKNKAVAEIIRILKPEGMLAISFDICEPKMGMTFPEWNGTALTIREFEDLFWFHPYFGNHKAPEWNTQDIPEFIEWHLKSAPHHNFTVGAALLTKALHPIFKPLFQMGDGWHSEERDGNDNWRWAAHKGDIQIVCRKSGKLSVNFQLMTALFPNSVRLELDNNAIANCEIGWTGFKAVESVIVDVSAGHHTLRFVSDSSPVLCLPDNRPLNFAVKNFHLKEINV